jgi:hypothetical protein
MKQAENAKELDVFLANFWQRIRNLSPNDKGQAFIQLREEFGAKLDALRDRASEIEFGQHVEGLHSSGGEGYTPTGP